MRKITVTVIVLFIVFHFSASCQDAKSVWKYVSIKKSVRTSGFPILSIGKVEWKDANGNGVIDGGESGNILLLVKNRGNGNAENLKVITQVNKLKDRLSFSGALIAGNILPGMETEIKIPVSAVFDIPTDSIEFTIQVKTTTGLQPETVVLKIGTRYNVPELKYAGVLMRTQTDAFVPGENISLEVLLSNKGKGDAEQVKIKLILSDEVLCQDATDISVGHLESGSSFKTSFLLVVRHTVKANSVPVKIQTTDASGRSIDTLITINLNSFSQSRIVRVAPTENKIEKGKINPVIENLSSDIDINIPISGNPRKDRFALVIGNQNYIYYNDDVKNITDVQYAINDAVTFTEYANGFLDIDRSNILTRLDVTAGKFSAVIERMKDLLNSSADSAELYIYYAGHGVPARSGKDVLLLPSDVLPTDTLSAFPLNKIIAAFSKTKANRIVVFLDACFSGTSRSSNLFASARGVRIIPAGLQAPGGCVVFSATNDMQAAFGYSAKQHGLFTYSLLNQIKQKPSITWNELSERVKQEVAYLSVRENGVLQQPEIKFSSELKEKWLSLRINERTK